MKIETLPIEGPLLIEPTRIGDARGFFSEAFRADRFEEAAGPVRFVQDNHSASAARGTIRGLHYQKEPRAQGKLIRVTKGAILDVAVDIRVGSPTYGRHVAVELSAENWRQLWVPTGFLHGFCTLVEDVEVIYKVTDYYSRDHDAGVRWDDPDIGVAWPISAEDARLSDKDRTAPLLREIGSEFTYRG
ncbi:dTDP-4-dehydrorhamnose 3,5-epimerase [Bosea caraganae]|uniref:dTDP-4-dehydrorhamnose 3,5-epimerase n=1 Tax=Bosea caraganae TaxID=2763117 RepID=A0A370L6Q0_9HYPH|nr:dTDP-4-dehydrorhamnose 3,5-epimerase [Bosea caraganae]RDJ25416.1 dTDP-4-dehydrorhamnose 3,5-epimerase [Bosea caraganae]RDJ25799.1 dTDP-4-dehydrorhamnose 3,5-epimerase [Bosea caraganae]